MQLGILISDYMKARGLSCRELAETIGVDHCTLYRFSRGRNIRLDALAKVVAWAWGPPDRITVNQRSVESEQNHA